MDNQNRLTVLLGAGAMMEVTTLSCGSITQKVVEKQQRVFCDNKWKSVPFLNYVYKHLKEYYTKESDNVNFEDIFHALEMLSSIQTATDEQVVKAARSVFGMLCNLKDTFSQISPNLVYRGMNDLIDTVVENVAAFETSVCKNKWFSDFFESVQKKNTYGCVHIELRYMVGADFRESIQRWFYPIL